MTTNLMLVPAQPGQYPPEPGKPELIVRLTLHRRCRHARTIAQYGQKKKMICNIHNIPYSPDLTSTKYT